MKNFIQPGDSLTVSAPYAVTSGQGVLFGALFGIAAYDAASSATVEIQTEGVFDITKEPSLAITAGARVYWDNTNRRITTTATGNYQVGIATLAALAADATVRVWTERVPASGA
jgi:predicted RecA/RadA family phage recombinase